MSMQYQCPHCKVTFETEEAIGDTRVDCPECGKEFVAIPLSIMVEEKTALSPVRFQEAWKRKWIRWDWHGRASKSEYWWAALAYLLEFAVLVLLGHVSSPRLFVIFYFVSFVPMNSLQARRLHDAGMTGKWVWGSWIGLVLFILGLAADNGDLGVTGLLVLLVGTLVLLVLSLLPGNKGPNKFGEAPV